MTYDVCLVRLKKKGEKMVEEVVPTPLTIHGMSYGSRGLPFAKKYVFADKLLSKSQAKKKGLEFHAEFVKYCQKASGHKSYFGRDAEGYYYWQKKESGFPHDKISFLITVRWLQVYITAIALGCGIRFE